MIKSNKLVLGRGRISGWARETKVIKTQSLSSKRSSPSKGGYVHIELHEKTEQGRAINVRLSPGSLDLQTLKRKGCKS